MLRWITIVLTIICFGEIHTLDTVLRSESILYGITSIVDLRKNGSVCFRDLKVLFDGVNERQPWALKVLDGSGTPGTAFLNGNNVWIGSHVFCQELQNTTPLKLNYEKLQHEPNTNYSFPPYKLSFIVSFIQHNSMLQQHTQAPSEDVIKLGVCVPNSCDVKDIRILLEQYFEATYLKFQELYKLNFKILEMKKLKEDIWWFFVIPKVIFAILLGAVLMILTLLGSINSFKNLIRNSKGYNSETALENKCVTSLKLPEKLVEILQCFDIIANSKSLWKMNVSSDTIRCIDGLKFFGMLYVILSHSIFFQKDFLVNIPTGYRLSEGLALQIITNCTYVVDGFFFLSGFLFSYLFYKHKKSEIENLKKISCNFWKDASDFCLLIFRRFVRLTPAYAFIILLTDLIFTYLKETYPMHLIEEPDVICDKYWWRNLFYINNLYPRSEMCLSWSYYVANDMQFFLISSFILVLSSRYFRISAAVTCFLLVLNIGINAYDVYKVKYIPTLDEQFTSIDAIYDLPWNRIGPYLIGLIAGYLFVIKMNCQFGLSKKTLILLWIMFPTLNGWILFALYGKRISLEYSVFYMSVSRSLWAIGIAWIVITCHTNNAGLLNNFLSFKGWVPFSKMTFCAYLINPLIVASISESSNTYTNISVATATWSLFASAMGTYVMAFPSTLLFEYPFINVLKLLLKTAKNAKESRLSNSNENSNLS